MRRTPALLVLVTLAIAGMVVGCGSSRTTPALELPSADQVAEMRVSVPRIADLGLGPMPEFSVPLEHVPKILFCLLPGEPDRFSVSEGVDRGIYFHVADILIRTKDGRELRLRCHDWGCNPVAFTPNGKDYYLGHSGDEQGKHPDQGCHDGGAQLYNAINKAHEARGK